MEAVKLAEIIQPPSRSSVRCENCGYGLKHRDHTGLRAWCGRCIDV